MVFYGNDVADVSANLTTGLATDGYGTTDSFFELLMPALEETMAARKDGATASASASACTGKREVSQPEANKKRKRKIEIDEEN